MKFDIEKLKKSKTFCPFPYMKLNSNTHGSVKICCAQNENMHLKKDDDTTFNLYEDDISEVWNSKHIQDIRKRLLNVEQIQE